MLDMTSTSYFIAATATATNTGTPAWVIIVTSIVGGGVVGSLVSTYVTSGREGRQARAKVRECLFETEILGGPIRIISYLEKLYRASKLQR